MYYYFVFFFVLNFFLLTVSVPLLQYVVACVTVQRAVGPVWTYCARLGHRLRQRRRRCRVDTVRVSSAATTARDRDGGPGRTDASGRREKAATAHRQRRARKTRSTDRRRRCAASG